MSDEPDILRRMKGLATVEPSAGSTARAVAAARRHNTRSRIVRWTLAGGVAAAVGLAAMVGVMSLTQQTATAAELLRQAAAATERYRGWVHIRIPDERPEIQIETHTNAETGASAFVIRTPFQTQVFMDVPTERAAIRYDSLTGEVQIGAMTERAAGQLRGRLARMPWTVAGLLSDTAGAQVKESRDGDLERYEATFPKENPTTAPATQAEEWRELRPVKAVVWADPATHLIRKGEMTGQDGAVQRYELTYGDPVIRDVYDIGVPREAKVVDFRPTGEEATILARLRTRYQAGFGEAYAAVRTETAIDPATGKPTRDAGRMTIYGQSGEAFMAKTYDLGDMKDQNGTLVHHAPKPAGWPTPTLADALRAAAGAGKPSKFLTSDVTGGYASGQGSMWSRMPTQKATSITIPRMQESLSGELWVTPEQTGMVGNFKLEAIRDPARPGLIGLRTEQAMPGLKSQTWRTTKVYWIDPSKDDILAEAVEQTVTTDGGADGVSWKMDTTYTDWTRTANGQWYPATWRKRIDSRPAGHPEARPTTLESRLQVWTGERLGAEWFADPAAAAKGAHPPAAATAPAR